jgi:hypothetical protein
MPLGIYWIRKNNGTTQFVPIANAEARQTHHEQERDPEPQTADSAKPVPDQPNMVGEKPPASIQSLDVIPQAMAVTRPRTLAEQAQSVEVSLSTPAVVIVSIIILAAIILAALFACAILSVALVPPT